MRKIKIILLLTAFFCLFSYTSTALAYELLSDGQITSGVEGLQYWRDSSIYEYRNSIAYGIQAWDGVTSEIEVTRTDTKAYSQADCYWGAYFPQNSDIIAECVRYINSTVVSNSTDDWYWCKLKFSSYLYNYDVLDYFHRKAVACHEFGHFLGLDENLDSEYNIMFPIGNCVAVEVPSTDDINGIISIYGP